MSLAHQNHGLNRAKFEFGTLTHFRGKFGPESTLAASAWGLGRKLVNYICWALVCTHVLDRAPSYCPCCKSQAEICGQHPPRLSAIDATCGVLRVVLYLVPETEGAPPSS